MIGNVNKKQNQKEKERKIEMGDKSPKAIKKKSAHEQTKTKKASNYSARKSFDELKISLVLWKL